MRVRESKSKNSISLAIIKSVVINGKNTSKIVESLGNLEEIKKKNGVDDPYKWARERAKKLTELEKEESAKIQLNFSPTKKIESNTQRSFNGGYLFLQQIYHQLGLHKICEKISKKHSFKYDLNMILSRLIYSQIIFPGSKRSTYYQSKKFLEEPNFELHQVYRALEKIFAENDLIQSKIYKNSLDVCKRNKKILYYDCTNFFFEIEEEDEEEEDKTRALRKYGHSKEHRPNPIVQLGLFMDGNGIPLAFDITPGNTNEQTTLKPLEKKILKDFELSKFIVCTDAGLSSTANRKYNDLSNRAFITTQSVKKLKGHLKEWALGEDDWALPTPPDKEKKQKKKRSTLSEIIEEDENSHIYYKERWIKENDLEQRLIISFSVKYKHYQEKIRSKQIERAKKKINSGGKIPQKLNANDYRRFIKQDKVTSNGELAENEILSLNQAQIDEEAQYDGFYAVCTNLTKANVSEIIKINQGRWEIEESFRIMKSEFKARPVHLSIAERIRAHFLICFLALIIYRILEKHVPTYTSCQILKTLREMDFLEVKGEGYIPTYTRTELTDELHEKAGFHTDFEIISKKNMKKIFKQTKSGIST